MVSTKYGSPDHGAFSDIFSELQSLGARGSLAVCIITRPPEILACTCITLSRERTEYIIFDSHPRPQHPDGSGIVLCKSAHAAASHLTQLLAVDRRLLQDPSLQWQAQLLSQYSGHIFVQKGAAPFAEENSALMQTVIESSLELLSLKAELVDLKFQNTSLTNDTERLERDIDDLETENREIKLQLRESRAPREHPAIHPGPILPSTGKGKAKEVYISDDSVMAQILQATLNDEDNLLSAERVRLSSMVPATFACGVCMDDLEEDYVARVDSCKHCLCRDCLRGYIRSKLQEHRYPILCPVCTAETNRSDAVGVVSENIIRDIGVSDEEYAVFEEMQMSNFSIILHCRLCKNSVFVDREEYQESRILTCPLPGCLHAWCKNCQQQIDMAGPPHSCDGSSELEHLMRERGWKHCPGCQTPIQKASGCNHMTCLSPGCNTHFCYVCGGMIVQSALRREVERSVTDHYRRCQLFEVPN